MHLIFRNLVIFLLGILSVNTSVYAIDLDQFAADAVGADPSVREQIHLFRQVNRDREIANSGWLPSVDLQGSTGNYETTSPSTSLLKREYINRLELSVTQNLFNGFETTYQQEQNEARLKAAMYQIFDTVDNVALSAVQSYLDSIRQNKLVELAQENVSSHERIASQIRERTRAGVGRSSELQQTEGRVARAHASLIAQQNNLQDSLTRMHELLGRYVDVKTVKESTVPLYPSLPLNELIDLALLKHPAIKVASHNITAAISDSHREKSNKYPKIDLRLAQETGSNISGLAGDTDQLSLVLNLSYNLFSGGSDKATLRKKVSVVHQNQALFSRARRQVINTLRLAWVADQSITNQLKFLALHINKSQQTVASYGEEFFIGQRDLIDLLDAENELNTAKIQHIIAFYDGLGAKFRILESMGLLLPALGLDMVVGEENIQISKVEAQGDDVLPLNNDRDSDKEISNSDHCDNTLDNGDVDTYGCLPEPSIQFGYNKGNRAPTAVDDKYEIEMNGVLRISQESVLENDSDEDNDVISLISFTQPGNGALAFDNNKNLIYRGADGFTGLDSFSYTITDGKDGVSTATVKIAVAKEENFELSEIQYINFVSNKVDLTVGSKLKIETIIQKLKRISFARVDVVAHTDSKGSKKYNLTLSKKRADTLMKLLISNGIDKKLIKSFGMGEGAPIADNATAEGQAINRRGELHVIF